MDIFEDIQIDEVGQIDPFMRKYRDTMARNRDASINQLNQQRENAQANIMSEANRAGMMYSNFPARSKMQYDVNTYNPSLLKIQSAYQTGLDSLRNKGVELANYLRQSQESLEDYDYYTNLAEGVYDGTGGNGNGTGGKSANTALNSWNKNILNNANQALNQLGQSSNGSNSGSGSGSGISLGAQGTKPQASANWSPILTNTATKPPSKTKPLPEQQWPSNLKQTKSLQSQPQTSNPQQYQLDWGLPWSPFYTNTATKPLGQTKPLN